jgi:hypothetical protein
MMNSRNWNASESGISDKTIRRIQIFSYLVYIICGISCLGYAIYEHENRIFMAMGSISLFYLYVIKYLPYFIKLGWTLWLHLVVMIIITGVVLLEVNKRAGEALLTVGIICMVVLFIRCCVGWDVCVRKETMLNGHTEQAVAYVAE